MLTRIIIDRLYRDGEVKKNESTPSEIRQYREANSAQQQRDNAARSEALRNQDSSASRNANHAAGAHG
jgi:hypothetical protein